MQHGSFTGRRIVLLVETDRRFFVVGYSIYRDGQSLVCCRLFVLVIIICLLPVWRRRKVWWVKYIIHYIATRFLYRFLRSSRRSIYREEQRLVCYRLFVLLIIICLLLWRRRKVGCVFGHFYKWNILFTTVQRGSFTGSSAITRAVTLQNASIPYSVCYCNITGAVTQRYDRVT